jgi:hypothetical protein
MTAVTAIAPVAQLVAAPGTRLWMAVITRPVYDHEFEMVLHEDYTFGPYPVAAGPGEPYRAEAMAALNLPEGHTLRRWYPQADPGEFCEF